MYEVEWRIAYALVARELNTKITLSWTHQLFVRTARTLFYFLHDKVKPQMKGYKKSILTSPIRVLLALFTFGWWRQNWLNKALHDVTFVTQAHEKWYRCYSQPYSCRVRNVAIPLTNLDRSCSRIGQVSALFPASGQWRHEQHMVLLPRKTH